MRGLGYAALLSLLLFISSCATSPAVRYPVHVTNTCVIDLLPESGMKGKIDALFSITMTSKDGGFNALAYLAADETGLYVSLLNDFGMEMASLAYAGGELSLSSSVLPKNIKAQYLAADLQFALYDEEAVRSALNAAGLALDVQGGKRTIRKGKKTIEEIETDGGNIKISNLLRGYELNAVEAEE